MGEVQTYYEATYHPEAHAAQEEVGITAIRCQDVGRECRVGRAIDCIREGDPAKDPIMS